MIATASKEEHIYVFRDHETLVQCVEYLVFSAKCWHDCGVGMFLPVICIHAAAVEHLRLVTDKQKFVFRVPMLKSVVLTHPKPVRVWCLLSRWHLGYPILWRG